jgi:hypothetical protein
MPEHIPSLSSLESDDDRPLVAELRLARVRWQVAVLRTLVDRAEYLARPGETNGFDEQLVEDMARLGCRLLEAAALLAERPDSDESGIFARARFASRGLRA